MGASRHYTAGLIRYSVDRLKKVLEKMLITRVKLNSVLCP